MRYTVSTHNSEVAKCFIEITEVITEGDVIRDGYINTLGMLFDALRERLENRDDRLRELSIETIRQFVLDLRKLADDIDSVYKSRY